MLDASCEGRDVGAEPKDGVGESIQKTEGLSKCQNGRCSPSECHLTNIDLVLYAMKALEHSKPPMFLQISLESFMFDALGYKS